MTERPCFLTAFSKKENTLLLSQYQQVVMRQTKRLTWFDFSSLPKKNESESTNTSLHQELERKTSSLKQQRRLSHSQKSRFLNNGSSDFLFIHFFCCNFTHLVAFLGHYCKTLPKVSNICYSYARGIRLNMSYGKKVLQSLTLQSAIT